MATAASRAPARTSSGWPRASNSENLAAASKDCGIHQNIKESTIRKATQTHSLRILAENFLLPALDNKYLPKAMVSPDRACAYFSRFLSMALSISRQALSSPALNISRNSFSVTKRESDKPILERPLKCAGEEEVPANGWSCGPDAGISRARPGQTVMNL